MTRRICVPACLAVLLPLRLGAAPETPPKEEPRKSGIVETTSTRLAQLDVTVSGTKDQVENLTQDDFEVRVDHKLVKNFIVDRLCGEHAAPAPPAQTTAAQAAQPGPGSISYLFYFDHPHLSMAGRQQAMDLARELIPKLVTGGNRAMIVSNAKGVTTVAPFTSDVDELLRALKKLEDDHDEWDYYPQQEQDRVGQLIRSLNKVGVDRAVSQAKVFYLEDRWRGERDARRLAMTLGLLTEVDPPKAVVYFADTTRNNPGDQYLDLFSESTLREATWGRGSGRPSPSNVLDRVIQEASAHGTRFYPIEARGLVTPDPMEAVGGTGSYHVVNQKIPAMIGVHEAQESMTTLALETGGHAFLNGIGADKIASRVLEDLSCVYLISFDPAGFHEDGPLPVAVEVKRSRVKVQTRGQLVIQSESARRTSKLMAAFVSPATQKSEVPMRMSVIPTGYVDGAFSALVQVAVAGGEVPGTTWDLGASLVSRERVREEGSGRISVNVAGAPVVFEREMKFSSGPYEIVSVAHEATTGQVASRRDEGSWPDPDAEAVVLGPIAVVQPIAGAFLRNGKASTSGTLAQSEQDPVRADRPTALVGIVCRGKHAAGKLRIERKLEGESKVDFPLMEIDMGSDRCALFRDLVPPGTMTAGFFRYEVRVPGGEAELARTERTFLTVQ